MYPRLIIGVVLLAVVLPVSARQEIRVTRIDANDGLSHNTVNDILQSSDGYLWVATYDGLNRYNGQEFETFRFPASLSAEAHSNIIENLFEDAEGRIWFFSSGVGYLDPATSRLVMVKPSEGPDHRGQEYRAVVDSSGVIWECGSALPGGCREADPTVPMDMPSARQVWDPVVAPDGRQWWVETDTLGGDMRMFTLGADGVSSKPVAGARFMASVQEAYTLGRGQEVWIAGKVPGLFDFETGVFTPVEGWPAGRLCAVIRELRDGSVLFGTEQGLIWWDPADGQLRDVSLTEGASPIGLWIQEMHEDREGIVWIGTRSGLYRLDREGESFTHWGTGSPDDPAGLPVALEMVPVDRGLWVGTLGRGLVWTDGDNFREYSRRQGTLCGDQVWSLLQAGGLLWTLTERGLCSFDPERHDSSSGVLRFATDGGVLAPADPDGMWFWSGDNPSSILRLDESGREMFEIDALMGPWSLFDDGRFLWIGGYGIHRVDLQGDGAVETIGLISNLVFDIVPARDSTLWLATDTGPAVLDRETTALRLVELDRPLPGRVTYSIVEDPSGFLWLGTNRGLVRLDPMSGQSRVFGAEDGVSNIEFDRRAVTRGLDGTVFFGGLDGVTVFHPDRVEQNQFAPRVAVAEVYVEEAGRPPRRIAVTEGVFRIPPRVHSFTLRLDALLFSDPNRVEARYRLVDYDPAWVSGRDVRYSRVKPGHYRFEAAATSVDGVEGPVSSLEVHVLPKFWQTWWFRILAAAFVAGVVWAFVSIRLAHRRRVEAMRLRIATDLHDEVGSHLSAIAMMADVIRKRNPDGRLGEISASARRMVQRLREIVWAVDPSSDHAGTLADHIQEIAATMLNGHRWEFSADVPDLARPLEMHVRHQIALVAREAFHNVVRHADADMVSITLRRSREGLILDIADDGQGFETAHSGHGLASMRQRAASLGGDLEVDSVLGGGTRLRLRVPRRSRAGWRDRVMRPNGETPTVGEGTEQL